MNDQEYLLRVLKQQDLADDSLEMRELRRRRGEVEKLLRDEFGSAPRIRYGGSKAKGTLNKEAYDLDMTCYFPRDDTSAGETLKEIFESVEKALQKRYRTLRKGSAMRLLDALDLCDSHVDVVSGRFVDNDERDVFLYSTSGEKQRLKTNLDIHIKHVRDSGVLDAIRLMKLWKTRRDVEVKTFAIELMTIDLLEGRSGHALPQQLRHVWTQLRDNIDNITIKDPANPDGNDLSELLGPDIRIKLQSESRDTLSTVDEDGWEAVFGPVDIDDEDEGNQARRAEVLARIAQSSPVSAKPWCAR
jgi:hypothetical protein